MDPTHQTEGNALPDSRWKLALIGFLAVAAFFLWTEHRAHLASNALIFGGFILLSSAWQVLYRAQKNHAVATTGPYAYVRHPQYIAFILIMFGFLLQWPTLITLLLFPVLVVVYARLARSEERDSIDEFGSAYDEYRRNVPAFIPRSGKDELRSGYQ